MATTQTTKTIIPIDIKATNIKVIQDAISRSNKTTKCYIQSSDGILFEITGTVTFRKVTKVQ